MVRRIATTHEGGWNFKAGLIRKEVEGRGGGSENSGVIHIDKDVRTRGGHCRMMMDSGLEEGREQQLCPVS